MQATTRFKEGDLVQVMAGRSRGKTGKVKHVDRSNHRVFIEKVNMVKRHMKPTQKQPHGGIIEKEAPVHWSSIQIVCGKCVKPVRIRIKMEKGMRQRVCSKCDQPLGN